MANTVTIASNAKSIGGKWLNHYYKSVYLGAIDNGGTDNHWGETELVSTTTGTGFPSIRVWLSHPLNAGYWYTLTFSAAGSADGFIVKKYNGDPASIGTELIDTIHASDTGVGANGNKWIWTGTSISILTIDLGVNLQVVGTFGDADAGDVIQINADNNGKVREALEQRKMFNNTYCCWMRPPQGELKAFNSDIIPFNLKTQSFNLILGGPIAPKEANYSVTGPKIAVFASYEGPSGDFGGNMNLVWSIDDEATITEVANSTYPAYDTANPWMYGRDFMDDYLYTGDVGGVLVHHPSSDSTGFQQEKSGISGHARLRFATYNEAGTTRTLAHNQWIPVFLIKS